MEKWSFVTDESQVGEHDFRCVAGWACCTSLQSQVCQEDGWGSVAPGPSARTGPCYRMAERGPECGLPASGQDPQVSPQPCHGGSQSFSRQQEDLGISVPF